METTSLGTAYVRRRICLDRTLKQKCERAAPYGGEAVKQQAALVHSTGPTWDLIATADWEAIAADLVLEAEAVAIVQERLGRFAQR